MIKDYTQLAYKSLKKRGLRSWLTMIGIFIGIAAVISLISLGQGLQSAITGQFSTLDPNKLMVASADAGFGPPGSTAVRKLNENDKELIESINGIDRVIPRLIRTVEVEYNEVSNFRYISNIPEEQEDVEIVYDSLNVEVAEGKLLGREDRKKVVLGSDFTDNSFGREITVGKKLLIQGETFEVVGILEKGNSFQVNSVILMPEEDLKRILSIEDEIDLLVVQVQEGEDLGQVADDIKEALRDDRNQDVGEEDFSVQTPEQGLSTINTILTIINAIVAGIAAVSLFVGGIGIMNTMYTAVLERTKEIGIMKAVGAKNKDILYIFLVEAGVLGLVGGVVGVIIGLGLAYLAASAINFAFPGLSFGVDFSPLLIISALGFSLLIGAISGTFPAMQASKLKPVDALRK